MKKLLHILIFALVAVMTACTGGGGVSDNGDRNRDVQLVDVCHQIGPEAETDALRTEAEIGAALHAMGHEEEGMAKVDSVLALLNDKCRFNELDAFIVVSRRKITMLGSHDRYAETLPLARRIIERLDDYEAHPEEYHDYIRFYRNQAQNYITAAYASLGEHDNMLMAFRQIENGVRDATAREHIARYNALQQQMEAERQREATRRAESSRMVIFIISLLILLFAIYVLWQWRKTNKQNRILAQQIRDAVEYKEKYRELSTQNSQLQNNSKLSTLNSTLSDAKLSAYLHDLIENEKLYLNPMFERQTLIDLWGEQGVTLFDGQGQSRAEVIAGNDGGCWTLGFARTQLYLQYINADGTLNPTAVIETGNDSVYCAFGKLTLGNDNNVFLTYETIHDTTNTFDTKAEKQIHLRGYATDGTQITPDVTLMATQYFEIAYYHRVIPDGLGGAYAYISVVCDSIRPTFKTLVFHHDANGSSTISDPYGASVHSDDHYHYYIRPYVSVDPVTHDLLIAYIQTNTNHNEHKVYANRITATGERVWDEGLLVYEAGDPLYQLSTPSISAFENGSGFAVTYFRLDDTWDTQKYTIEAAGYDMNCNVLWSKQLCSNNYPKIFPETISGFHNGQNIIAWGKLDKNIIYGQNFGVDGSMGQGLDVEEIFEDEEIINIEKIFNVNGQVMQCNDLNELNTGVYIIQGTTESGKMVNKKAIKY